MNLRHFFQNFELWCPEACCQVAQEVQLAGQVALTPYKKATHWGQKVDKFETRFWDIFYHELSILKPLMTVKPHRGRPCPKPAERGYWKRLPDGHDLLSHHGFFFIRSPFRGGSFYHLFTHSAIFLSYFADILTIVALEREEIVAWGAFKRVCLIQVEFCLQCTVHLVEV